MGNNSAGVIEFGPFDAGKDGKRNGVGFVEITTTFAMQDDFALKRYLLTECLFFIRPALFAVPITHK